MFIVMGAVGLIVAAAWFLFYRDALINTALKKTELISAPAIPPALRRQSESKQWGRLFRCRTTWGMIIGNFGGGYLTGVYSAWLPGFLEIQHHMSIARTSIFAAILPVFGIAGSLFGGYTSGLAGGARFSHHWAASIPIICGLPWNCGSEYRDGVCGQ